MNIKNNLKDFLMITIATAICAVAIHFFLVPSQVSVGSISGLAIIINHFVPLSVSALTFILNAGLLVLGFLLLGREFGAKTVYTSILLPIFIRIAETFYPDPKSIMGDPFLDMLGYLFVVSIGLAMLFIRNASSGGLDIVAKLINKFFRMDLGKAMSLAGMCVAVSSILVYDVKTMALSVLGTYLNGIVLDHFIFGMDQKRRVCILSPKIEELRDYIINDLHSGATIYQAIGAYDHTPHQEIVVIVNKTEYVQLMAHLEKLDPTAFITVYAVGSVSCQPKPRVVRGAFTASNRDRAE